MALIAVILAGSVLFLILVSTGLARTGRLRSARPGRSGQFRHGRVAVAGIGLMAVEDTRTRREAPSTGTVPTAATVASTGTVPHVSEAPSRRRLGRGFEIDDAAVAETPEVAAAREHVAALLKEAQDRADALVSNAEAESVALRRRAEEDTERAGQVVVEAQRSAAQVLADVRERSRELEQTAEQQAAERLYREATAPRVQVRRFDVAAVAAVIEREVLVWLRTWKTMTFAAIVEPVIFLLAFGLGIGAMIKRVQGVDYIQFVGTGVVATTVVFSSAFPSMFQTFVKSRFQKLYDAILSTPVDVGELVTADMLWTATRTGVYALAPLLVAVAFGLRPGAGAALVPPIAFITAFGFAGFGISIAAKAKAITSFNYVISGLLTPLLLVAGAYFPVEDLPRWAFIANQFNPLYHCVQLVRHAAVFGIQLRYDVWHFAALLLFCLITWTLSVRLLKPTLID
jgi:lipooligosaccharide transport system permease protein